VIYDIVKVTQEPKNREMLGKVMNLWAVSGPEFGRPSKWAFRSTRELPNTGWKKA